MRKTDIDVENHFSIFLFSLNTKRANAWVDENCSEPMFFGRKLVVEPRYAENLIKGMIKDNLLVRY